MMGMLDSVNQDGRSSCLSFDRIAVGTPITERPPHRSQRAQLTHWAPTSGV
jgi:hypothetical protein